MKKKHKSTTNGILKTTRNASGIRASVKMSLKMSELAKVNDDEAEPDWRSMSSEYTDEQETSPLEVTEEAELENLSDDVRSERSSDIR